MEDLEKVINYYCKGFVIQKVAPSTYEVWGPKTRNEAGQIVRIEVGQIDSLAGARELVMHELTKPVWNPTEERWE